MKKIIFTNVTCEYKGCGCCWGMEPPAQHTETGPYEVRVPDQVPVDQVASCFFDGAAVSYDYQESVC